MPNSILLAKLARYPQQGGYTKGELKVLGYTWPPPKGWKLDALKKFGLEKKYNRNRRKHAKANKKARRSKPKGDPFYRSWHWKKARYETLVKYGPKCMLCGSEDRIVVDHIKPRSRFPELQLDLDNLQVLCNDCNMGKSNDDYTDFRPQTSQADIVQLEIVHEATKHI